MPIEPICTDRGRFVPGHTGNPRGRPPGSRNHEHLADRLDKLALASAEAIVEGLIERAKAGDALCADLVLSRAWPSRGDVR